GIRMQTGAYRGDVMDYLFELASAPDVYEAITIDKQNKEARELLFYAFLREEHPTTWTTEIVHAFYSKPEFAARIWKNLRYCETFRRMLARYVLDGLTTWVRQPDWKDVPATARRYTDKFGTNPDAAVREYAEALKQDREEIDRVCDATKQYPPPPAFLRALIANNTALVEKKNVLLAFLRALIEKIGFIQKRNSDPRG